MLWDSAILVAEWDSAIINRGVGLRDNYSRSGTPRKFNRGVGLRDILIAEWALVTVCCDVIGCHCGAWVLRDWSVQMTVCWLIAEAGRKGGHVGEILPRIFCGIMPPN